MITINADLVCLDGSLWNCNLKMEDAIPDFARVPHPCNQKGKTSLRECKKLARSRRDSRITKTGTTSRKRQAKMDHEFMQA